MGGDSDELYKQEESYNICSLLSVLQDFFLTFPKLWSRKVMSIGLWQWLILTEAWRSMPPTVMLQELSKPTKEQQRESKISGVSKDVVMTPPNAIEIPLPLTIQRHIKIPTVACVGRILTQWMTLP